MYFTATSPYIFMLILLIRMAFLPGAREGLLYYLVPDFDRMTDMEVGSKRACVAECNQIII